ncbi:UTRA domain-containing protein [Acinetobacter baumannii]|uniref:UTRA domain-containing protein n=1 Tax=Acinetobacter baumannii TaxID=470 RepID=UPI0005A71457|nr:UTRA domain-containing protein [Acinetobacter baumannii]
MPRTSKQEHTELSIEADSPVPLYQRVKQLISQKIYEGSWAVNKKIPSESELVNQLGCSRMTVNRALRELTTEGLLVRIQGVGSFVAEGQGRTALFQINNIADEQKLFHSIIVHYENDVPVQVEDRLVDAALIPDYLEQDFKTITPNAYLMAKAPVTEGEHIVEAVLASPQECKWLKITKAEPCLLIRRRTWSNKQLISSARLIYPGSRYYLEGKFNP